MNILKTFLNIRAKVNRTLFPRSLRPLSSKFGYDRGTPIDRFWIESFLEENKKHIKGRVLEVTDPAYTKRFGGDKVIISDVLDIDSSNVKANIHADLRNIGGKIKDNTYDCIILTHVLGMIDEYDKAVTECRRILKKGGVMVFTGSCLGPQLKNNYSYWKFTPKSVEFIMKKYFKPTKMVIRNYGNVLTAQAFLLGMSQEDLTRKELQYNDDRYPCVVGALLTK